MQVKSFFIIISFVLVTALSLHYLNNYLKINKHLDKRPIITNVAFAPYLANGLYISGEKIPIIVSFSEPVMVDLSKKYSDSISHNCQLPHNDFPLKFRENLTNLCNLTLTETPFIIMETGVKDQIAKYTHGSGSNDLSFEYTVQPNDSSFEPPRNYRHQRLGLISGAHSVPWNQWLQGKNIVITSPPNSIRGVFSSEDADLNLDMSNYDPLREDYRKYKVLIDGKSPMHWKYHTITAKSIKDLVAANGSEQTFLIDFDSDDDIDILSVSTKNGIIWHKNMGDKSFSSSYINEDSNQRTVSAGDFNNDGYIDVVVGGRLGIYLLENINNQTYIRHDILFKEDQEVSGVSVADIDGDGDQDILAAIQWTGTYAWYENIGELDNFIEHIITNKSLGAHEIFAIDVDLDNDLDIVTASFEAGTVAWHENDGSQRFTEHKIKKTLSASSIDAIDLDQDGDIDILADSAENDSIMWYENNGKQNFTEHIITTNADRAYDVFPTDIDNDGDIDLLSASSYDHKIAWYENDGKQNFVSHIITTQVVHASSVTAADLDNDGDIDVVSTSVQGDVQVEWYENTLFN
jgi:hypothetical protein